MKNRINFICWIITSSLGMSILINHISDYNLNLEINFWTGLVCGTIASFIKSNKEL